jgi:hypothetical protein
MNFIQPKFNKGPTIKNKGRENEKKKKPIDQLG